MESRYASMRAVWTTLVVASLMAGCAEGDSVQGNTDDDTFADFDDVDVSEDKGIIRGVVLTEAIVPIAGARVTLAQSGKTVETNDNGAFQFVDLDPGTYILKTRALGFETIQSSVAVEAGVAEPQAIKVVLPADPDGMPYFDDHYFAGFIQCGVRTPAAGVAVCGGVNDFTGLGDDTYSSLYDTGGNISHLQTEMVWENTQTLGDSFSVAHRYATQENYDGGFYDGSLTGGAGPSPLLVVTPADEYNNASVGQGEFKFLVSIFATDSETVPGFGLALQQKYELFIHEFHGYKPPEDWRFSQEPSVPPPS